MAHHAPAARVRPTVARGLVLSGRELGVDELAGAGIAVDPERVAVVASWSERPAVSRSLQTLVGAIAGRGYQTFLVRASDDAAPLDWDPPSGVTVVRRPNEGYDFGSWAALLRALPAVAGSSRVLFANDSLVGPFADIGPVLETFERGTADAWGGVMSAQVFPHIQSYLFGFRNGILSSSADLRAFWAGVTVQESRDEYIARYELGLNRALFSDSLSTDAAFGIGSYGYRHVNPTLDEWRTLLHRGFPFVKRALLTDVDDRVRADAAAEEIRALYGADVAEWI